MIIPRQLVSQSFGHVWRCGIPNLAVRSTSFHYCVSHRQRLRTQQSRQTQERIPNQSSRWKYVGLAVATAATGFALYYQRKNAHMAAVSSAKSPLAVGEFNPHLSTYSADEVLQHDSKDKRIWVTYKSGVYDITDFVAKHPGGEKILMASGGALEPFWLLYAVHQNEQVLAMLEELRIGNLAEADRGVAAKDMDDPYAMDPKRHPALKPSSVKPFNAEPFLPLLVESYITPNDLFYVRNHLPVPEVDPDTYELEVVGEGITTVNLSLNDLKNKFKKHTVTAAIQCAGNRRSEMIKLKPIKGLNWGAAAISNATWSGARLSDVLKYAGLSESNPTVKHIQFEGLDLDPAGSPYGSSIFLKKAIDPAEDVILAYEMNGVPLPRDHGFPVRAIVPGIVGARNVKWLGRIIASSDESPSHWQQNDYKGFPPHIDWDTVDFKSAPAIQEQPVQSAVCDPTDGSVVKLKDNSITLRGYAWSGGGRGIVRVDVSIDDGKNWHTAKLDPSDLKLHSSWAWTLWKIDVPVPKTTRNLDVCCRAIDSSYNIQPESVEPLWNLRGVLNNAWHRIRVKVES